MDSDLKGGRGHSGWRPNFFEALRDSDQIIKAEHGRDRSTAKYAAVGGQFPWHGLTPLFTPDHPRPVQRGGVGVRQTPCLFAPADDRNALVTTAGGIVLAVRRCTLKPILAATPTRSISLASPETVNSAPGKTKMKADLASRFSTRSARKFSHEQSESYTVSRPAAN